MYIFFPNFGCFETLFVQILFFNNCFLSCFDSNDTNIRSLDISCNSVLMLYFSSLISLSIFFSPCFSSLWLIYIHLSSNSPMLSSVISILMAIKPIQKNYLGYYIFQLKNFHYVLFFIVSISLVRTPIFPLISRISTFISLYLIIIAALGPLSSQD